MTRDKVLAAALRLADTHGLAWLSMRKLAAELGVEAMSLYNHVASKSDLLDGMASRVFELIELPDPALPWPDRIRALGVGAHNTFSAHPVVVGALASDQANPRSIGALRLIDALLGALLDAGLDERAAAQRYRSLLGLLFGLVLSDSMTAAGDRPERDAPIADWFGRIATADALPSLHRVLPALLDQNCAPDVEQEIEFFIAGVRSVARTRRKQAGRGKQR
ncbi:TetR/AcrR family transcriptional regulator [Actinoallomurus sp. CA-142502]|uniref:TetR/AcrR family transcriptional regulator n=1 Tax=Actinoallomurus sp. CA-142502 TaxID=3239885 RepID=UPI003D8FD694